MFTFSSSDDLRTDAMNFAATDSMISNFVSRSKILMTPISFLVTWPRRQITGKIHLGSALLLRPTFIRNQTMGSLERCE